MSAKFFDDPNFYNDWESKSEEFKQQATKENKTTEEFFLSKQEELLKKIGENLLKETVNNKKTENGEFSDNISLSENEQDVFIQLVPVFA